MQLQTTCFMTWVSLDSIVSLTLFRFTESALLLLPQLEALVQGLEESFAVTEDISLNLSPGAVAKAYAEKERRRALIKKISHALTSSNHKSEWAEGNTEDSLASCKSLSDANVADSEGSVEWKRNTLIRLRKFLKKKYRQKKSE
jgi:hypothetical protein